MASTHGTEHLPDSLSASRSDPETWRREHEPTCSRRKHYDMAIYTERRVLVRDLSVIGPAVQSLTTSLGHCLARFEAPLARRALNSFWRHRAYKLWVFATPFHTNDFQARPYRRLTPHEAVIGSCAAIQAVAASRHVLSGRFAAVDTHLSSTALGRPSNET